MGMLDLAYMNHEYQNNDWGTLGLLLLFFMFFSVLSMALAITISIWDIRKIKKSVDGIFSWRIFFFFRRHSIFGFFAHFFLHLFFAILGLAIGLLIMVACDEMKAAKRPISQQPTTQ